jgi:hypothetical protein
MAVEGVLPPSTVDPDTARRTVEEVLRRPEYAELSPSWWDRFTEAFRRAVGELLADLAGTGTGSAVGWIILAVIVGVVGWLLWRWGRSVRREGAAQVATTADVGRAPAAWIADAQEHERAGRWRDAVRCRYRALVADLAAAGRLEEVPGRTTGEYLARLREARPDAAEPFAAATGVFERAWYGQDDVDAQDVEAVREAAGATVLAAGMRRSAVDAERVAQAGAGR